MAGGRDDDAIRANAAAAGLRVELPPEPETEVWPENWTAMEVAIRMMSQLNVGMNGVVGLRYEALPVVLDCMAVPASDRLEVLDGLRIIEHEIVRKLNDRGRRGD